MEDIFFTGPGVGDGSEMFQAHYIIVHFISVITASVPHQAESWGPLL